MQMPSTDATILSLTTMLVAKVCQSNLFCLQLCHLSLQCSHRCFLQPPPSSYKRLSLLVVCNLFFFLRCVKTCGNNGYWQQGSKYFLILSYKEIVCTDPAGAKKLHRNMHFIGGGFMHLSVVLAYVVSALPSSFDHCTAL